jgi:hypothetical protein
MAKTGTTEVRKQVVVEAPIERAFTVFTDRFGDFKPPEHNLLGAPIAETVFEPRVGGGIVDRAEDGSECRWARILALAAEGMTRSHGAVRPLRPVNRVLVWQARPSSVAMASISSSTLRPDAPAAVAVCRVPARAMRMSPKS